MVKMTPEQEAAYALDYGLDRSGLPGDVRAAYDRLAEQRARAGTPGPVTPAQAESSGNVTLPLWASAVLTVVSFPAGPGVVLVLVPWLITGFNAGSPPWPAAVRVLGLVLLVLGVVTNVATFAWFVIEGRGTPFPTNPPSSRTVMVRGPYGYVRNPMYVSYFVAIAGEALLFSRPALLVYLPVFAVLMLVFVHWWEEPTMKKRYGAEYQAYLGQVPGWWPRLRRRAGP